MKHKIKIQKLYNIYCFKNGIKCDKILPNAIIVVMEKI